ncbi:3-hydroxyacyl-CoA dehydrogenase family protein [Aquicoccus sp. SU-CL01552]|uniref:3-hydroxyacyl-CoA dehydrogenase family protein n=1 Tax=Aquicoccus sp. SU-CL01552 TaxID=3127656 RepID=UPI0031060CC9
MARALIVGAGPAGVMAARLLTHAGYAVVLAEPDPDDARRIRDMLAQAGLTLTVVDGPGDPTGAQIVMEAMEEDPGPRTSVLEHLERTTAPDSLLLSTTPTGISGRVIGFRLYTAVQSRNLVEIAPGPGAREPQIAAAFALAATMGRHAVRAPHNRASIGTRLMRRLYEAADTMLLQGAIPHELDEAMVALGWDMGLYEAQDLAGLVAAYADRKAQVPDRDPDRLYVPIQDRVVEEGRLGKSAGVGWYRYPGGGGAVIDPLVEDLLREEAWFAGVTPRGFGAEEMQERLVMALIHEGALLLADGTAATAGDIDTVSRAGLGFPVRLGGVIAHADALGADRIAEALMRLAVEDPLVWTPPEPILDCAGAGRRLAEWRPLKR